MTRKKKRVPKRKKAEPHPGHLKMVNMSVYDPNYEITCQDTGEVVKGNMYLESRHWKNLSRAIWITRGKRCELCGAPLPNRNDANIHHDNYGNIGHEKESDLMLLCRPCHERVHDPKEGGKVQRWPDFRKMWQAMTYTQRMRLCDAAKEIMA